MVNKSQCGKCRALTAGVYSLFRVPVTLKNMKLIAGGSKTLVLNNVNTIISWAFSFKGLN
jgi:hypothetical protein